jgi:hypothetical protein
MMAAAVVIVALFSRPSHQGRGLRSHKPIPANGSLRTFWNTADAGYSHINYNTFLGSEAKLVAGWMRLWLDKFAADSGLGLDSVVVEYGFGAALLGDTLLSSP